MGCPATSASYEPRRTHESDAARIVCAHLPDFLARLDVAGGVSLPSFVVDELRGFGTCGDFEQGFLVDDRQDEQDDPDEALAACLDLSARASARELQL